MLNEMGNANKADAVVVGWAMAEYQKDKDYWTDRARNGRGLIQQIADFVIEQGAGAHSHDN